MVKEEMEKRHGAVGLEVLTAVVRAAESPENFFSGKLCRYLTFDSIR